MNRLRIAACNFLRNGGGDRDCRNKMYALLKSLRIDVLGRMELVGCEDPSTGLWDESRKALGMEGVLAPHLGATAVYWNAETLMFSPTPDARWKGIEHWRRRACRPAGHRPHERPRPPAPVSTRRQRSQTCSRRQSSGVTPRSALPPFVVHTRAQRVLCMVALVGHERLVSLRGFSAASSRSLRREGAR